MKRIIIIGGPTAVGKTKYSIEIAKAFNGEIVSCDSMQLYKYMNIGSAKPTPEELAQVPHHLVDCIEPKGHFSVAKYQKLAKEAINDIFSRGKTPVIAGGTGLYMNSLIYDMDFSAKPEDDSDQIRNTLFDEADKYGPEYIHNKLAELDPAAAERIHPNNVKKVVRAIEAAMKGSKVKDISKDLVLTKDYDISLIALNRNREELYNRINMRVDMLMEAGLVEEVKGLMAMGLGKADISMKGIGYKEIIAYLEGKCTLDEAIYTVKKNTRHYAKKQLSWLRRYDTLKWFNISEYSTEDECVKEIITWLQKN